MPRTTPVEQFDDDAVGGAGLVDDREHRVRQDSRIDGPIRMPRVGFHFDDEMRTGVQPQHVAQRRDAGTVTRFLRPVQNPVNRIRPDPANVIIFEFRQCQGADQRWRTAQEYAPRVAGDVGIERGIVTDHDDTVRRHADIQFERAHTHGEGVAKTLERVLRKQAARAAMANDLNLSCHVPSCHVPIRRVQSCRDARRPATSASISMGSA